MGQYTHILVVAFMQSVAQKSFIPSERWIQNFRAHATKHSFIQLHGPVFYDKIFDNFCFCNTKATVFGNTILLGSQTLLPIDFLIRGCNVWQRSSLKLPTTITTIFDSILRAKIQ